MKSKRFYGESNPDHVRDSDTFLPLNYRIRWDLHKGISRYCGVHHKDLIRVNKAYTSFDARVLR